jgi:hypothetical protein
MIQHKTINARLEAAQYKAALRAAKTHRVSLSVIVRWALDSFLEREQLNADTGAKSGKHP